MYHLQLVYTTIDTQGVKETLLIFIHHCYFVYSFLHTTGLFPSSAINALRFPALPDRVRLISPPVFRTPPTAGVVAKATSFNKWRWRHRLTFTQPKLTLSIFAYARHSIHVGKLRGEHMYLHFVCLSGWWRLATAGGSWQLLDGAAKWARHKTKSTNKERPALTARIFIGWIIYRPGSQTTHSKQPRGFPFIFQTKNTRSSPYPSHHFAYNTASGCLNTQPQYVVFKKSSKVYPVYKLFRGIFY